MFARRMHYNLYVSLRFIYEECWKVLSPTHFPNFQNYSAALVGNNVLLDWTVSICKVIVFVCEFVSYHWQCQMKVWNLKFLFLQKKTVKEILNVWCKNTVTSANLAQLKRSDVPISSMKILRAKLWHGFGVLQWCQHLKFLIEFMI